MRRLLLGSGGFKTPEMRDSWSAAMDGFLGPIEQVLFIPYAVEDYSKATQKMVEYGFHAGRNLKGIDEFKNPKKAVEEAQAIFIGGGNSFRLLHFLYENRILESIRDKVHQGTPYLGISAGTNMACPTMMTTNDMPIIEPKSLKSLGLIPFQINPHYTRGKVYTQTSDGLYEPYGGETRDDRLREFHQMNSTPVVAIYEGSTLHYNGEHWDLINAKEFRLFERGKEVKDSRDLSQLDRWMYAPPM